MFGAYVGHNLASLVFWVGFSFLWWTFSEFSGFSFDLVFAICVLVLVLLIFGLCGLWLRWFGFRFCVWWYKPAFLLVLGSRWVFLGLASGFCCLGFGLLRLFGFGFWRVACVVWVILCLLLAERGWFFAYVMQVLCQNCWFCGFFIWFDLLFNIDVLICFVLLRFGFSVFSSN